MKLYDLTVPELNILREQCNFTDEELQYFNMKSRDKSHVEIAMKMNISEAKVAKLSKRVRNKILRIQFQI